MENSENIKWMDGTGYKYEPLEFEDSHLSNLIDWTMKKIASYNQLKETEPEVAEFLKRKFVDRQGKTFEEWHEIFIKEIKRRIASEKKKEIAAIEKELDKLKSREEKVEQLKKRLAELQS